MAKYLPHFGWTPFILTNRWTSQNGPYDPTIVEGIPEGTGVYRVGTGKRIKSPFQKITGAINRILLPHTEPKEFFKKALAVLPRIILEHKIKVIWATYPPLADLAIADKVSRQMRIPWLADFRDAYQFTDTVVSKIMRPNRLFYEKRIVKSASIITSVSEGFSQSLENRHMRKVEVVHNGFDPDITDFKQSNYFPKFEIVYTGGINFGRPDLKSLFDVLEELITMKKLNPKDIQVTFYGEGNERKFKKTYRKSLSSIVRDYGYICRRECLDKQRNATILLLFTAPGTGWMTSKVYEYLVAQRPVLAIPHDGRGISKVLLKAKAGISCTTKNEIAKAIMRWYEEWKNTGTVLWEGNKEYIAGYSRKKQANQTAILLDRAISVHGQNCTGQVY
ncbi:MAG: glycosyltransferase [Candidatus Omnitrophota bacterium]